MALNALQPQARFALELDRSQEKNITVKLARLLGN